MKNKMLVLLMLVFVLILCGCQRQEYIGASSDNSSLKTREIEQMEDGNVEPLESNSGSVSTIVANITDEEQSRLNEALEIVAVPDAYVLESVAHGSQDDLPITVYRYTKDGEKNQGGEHFSITVSDRDNKLIGFTFMDSAFALSNGNIKEDEANRIAIDFLNRVEPGLVEKSRHLWTDKHDETITVNENDYVISGMKYKCYVQSKDVYYWVIVGHTGQIITFEQDIVWSNGMSERISEQWLHDWWRAENNN